MAETLTFPRKQALESPETNATVLHAIVLQQYGEDWYSWDPATVYLELQADFNADTCAEALDRLSAIQVIMGSDAVFKRLDAFLGCCNTLAGGEPFFSAFDPVTLEEAAWGITEIALNRDLRPFSYAIRKYVRMLMRDSGFSTSDYPEAFRVLFDATPDSDALRDLSLRQSAADLNDLNIADYVAQELQDISTQFDRLPDLRRVDDLLPRGPVTEVVDMLNLKPVAPV